LYQLSFKRSCSEMLWSESIPRSLKDVPKCDLEIPTCHKTFMRCPGELSFGLSNETLHRQYNFTTRHFKDRRRQAQNLWWTCFKSYQEWWREPTSSKCRGQVYFMRKGPRRCTNRTWLFAAHTFISTCIHRASRGVSTMQHHFVIAFIIVSVSGMFQGLTLINATFRHPSTATVCHRWKTRISSSFVQDPSKTKEGSRPTARHLSHRARILRLIEAHASLDNRWATTQVRVPASIVSDPSSVAQPHFEAL